MKRIVAVILLTLLVTLFMLPQSFAIGETMTAKRGTPVIDGEIDEVWKNADRQELAYVKAGDLKEFEPDVEKAFASALWDDTYIYFLFEVTDNDPVAITEADPNTAQDWKNDTIFLYIDETYARPEASPWDVAGTYQFSICVDGNTRSPRNGTYGKEIKAAVKNTDTGFIIEVAFEPEVVKLADGLQIGVDYQYNDGTEFSTRDYCLGWSDETDVASGNASVWGTLKLSAEPAGDTEQPAETPAAEPAAEEPAEEVVVSDTPEAEAPKPAETPAAPQTGDMMAVVTAVLVGVSACGTLLAKKRRF
ncbi:MAG: hypothetical protein GX067_03370 [Clostridiales bacterium]|jgi:pyruvate/2-oxoglutarate dehydrogenase complex dihydrolipoamide acyltransferase (E2) component|nr:hypothetical protein [Clostridiales bacterium]